MKTKFLIPSILFLLYLTMSFSFLDTNVESKVEFRLDRSNTCAGVDKSYEFKVYEDGEYIRRAEVIFKDERWSTFGTLPCSTAGQELCYGCSIDEAVVRFYNKVMNKQSGSIRIVW